MARFRPCFLVLLLGVAAARSATLPPPSEWKLPPVDGEIAGEFNATTLGGAPPLNWKLTTRTEKPRERTIDFRIEGQGLRLHCDARVDPLGEGSWRIAEAEISLAEWGPWLLPRFAPDLVGASVSGMLQVQGEGTWRGGVLGGRVSLSLREGRIDDPVHTLLLEGISVDVQVSDLAARRTVSEQIFTWRSGRYDVVALGVGRIEFALDGDQLRVKEAAIDVFGGELRIGSLVMSTRRPEFAVTAQMNGVELDQIMFLLPPLLSEARGKVDGEVELKRDAAGIQIGNGRMALRQSESADLRLATKQGWLSTSLPPVIMKYFPGFRKIETGEIPIRARVLEMTFTPLGDAAGRTAWVHLAGGPSDPELTAPIDATFNVYGPLDQLVKIGADLGATNRLRFGGAR